MSSRFATLLEKDLNVLLDDKDAKTSKGPQIKLALKVFHQYFKEKKADEPHTKDILANVLELFYPEVRKVEGTFYTKSTLNSLIFRLNWHFKATRGLDTINTSESTDTSVWRKVFRVQSVSCAKCLA